MLPALNHRGYLPPGIHVASIEEIVVLFGQGSEQRVAQGESLRWLIPLCKNAGISRLVVNGSFVTNRTEPNDVDCVLLQGIEYKAHSPQAVLLRQGLPFLELRIVSAEDFDFFTRIFFHTDRDMIPKGIVEVQL